MKARWVLWTLFATAIALSAILSCRTFLLPLQMMEDQNPGEFKQKNFTVIVETTRKLTPPGTEEMRFYLNDLSTPSCSFKRAVPARSKGWNGLGQQKHLR